MSIRDEIYQQPAVIRRLLNHGREAAEIMASRLRCEGVHSIYLAARGTSDYAATYAKYLLGIRNPIRVALAAPSIFSLYGAAPDLQHALVLAISQSGASPDILGGVSAAASQGRATAAITNTPSSALAAQAESMLELLAGEQRSIAATKTYTAEHTGVAMLSAAPSGRDEDWDHLRAVPVLDESVLSHESQDRDAAEAYAAIHRCMILSWGPNLPTAQEWGLKRKELAGVFAEGLVHGRLPPRPDGRRRVGDTRPGGGALRSDILRRAWRAAPD